MLENFPSVLSEHIQGIPIKVIEFYFKVLKYLAYEISLDMFGKLRHVFT